MLLTFMVPDFINDGERGKLVQLVHEGWKQFNVITSTAGSVRGGHFHKFNEEGFYVISGKFDLYISFNDITEEYRFGSGDMFKIPAYNQHTFKFLENTVLVSMYSEGVELASGEKDIWI